MNKKNKNKLWIFTELFYPEETSTSLILLQIANKLSEKYYVNVITGSPVYFTDKNGKPVEKPNTDINIKKIVYKYINKDDLLKRTKRALYLSFMMMKEIYQNVLPGQSILAVTNPPNLIVLIAILKKVKHFKFCILVHDVFPENSIAAKIFKNNKNLFYILLKYIYDIAYRQADIIITCGRDMNEYIEKKVRKNSKAIVKCITNWADIERIYPLPQQVMQEKIILKYAGNFGRVQGLKKLFDIISEVNNQKLLFIFQGSGAIKKELEEIIIAKKIKNIKILGSYSRSDENKILNDCNIGVVSLDEQMEGFGVPSKVYNIMAAGKPVLYIGSKRSEVSRMINENGIGYSFLFSQSIEIINFLNNISDDKKWKFIRMGTKSRKIAETKYSQKESLKKFMDIL